MVYYVLGDHLGSTAITVDSSGAKASELRYKPYGETRYSGLPAGTGTDYRFTGQRQLAGLGLYHMGARWIDPSLGRWLSADTIIPDPANPQSFNRYSYGYNNPVKFVDTDGHFAWIPVAIAGGLIGGTIYGYGTQVYDNLKQGKNLGQALTTNIDPGKVAMYAGAGAVIGTGLGLVAVGAEAVAGTAGLFCSDGNCTNEGRAVVDTVRSQQSYANQASTAGQTAQRTILWMEQQINRVQHIMDPKHGWSRLVEPSGDLLEDYRAVQPYLQEAIGTEGIQINTSPLGPVMEYLATINGEQVVVRAIDLAGEGIQIVDAWVENTMSDHICHQSGTLVSLLANANQLRHQKSYEAAVALYLHVLEQFGETAELFATIAHCYFALDLGNSDRTGENLAVTWMKRAVDLMPDSGRYHADLAQFYALGALDYEIAAQEYRRAMNWHQLM